jgi:hypothetical protein
MQALETAMGMNMLRKKSLVVVQLLLVALSLLVAACGNDTAQTNLDPPVCLRAGGSGFQSGNPCPRSIRA